MDKVYLEINKCEQCPHKKVDRYYTADPYENEWIYSCKASENKEIGIYSWSEKQNGIPKWCPLRGK